MLMLMGWWKRETRLGAFTWGLIGACLGQIHMSGFFFAAGFFVCTLLLPSAQTPRGKVRWAAWFGGSVLGALPLIPWLGYLLEHPTHEAITKGWTEIIQAKFWVFWISNPLGLHLGNPLGLLRGQSTWAQISDFVRYPVLDGHATYLNGVAHLTTLVAGVTLFFFGIRRALTGRFRLTRPRTQLELALISAVFGFGILLTLSGVNIRRYYTLVVFPLEFVWLTSLAWNWAAESASRARIATGILATLWVSEWVMSACLVGYVHVNEGATQGDYGDAYHVILRKKAGGH
jgi:hypothetical protein